MITKKDYVLSFLDSLLDVWPAAPALKDLVVSGEMTDEMIDGLIPIFQEAINTVRDDQKRQKLQEGITFLQKLQEREERERQEEHKHLDSLLDSLE